MTSGLFLNQAILGSLGVVLKVFGVLTASLAGRGSFRLGELEACMQHVP